MSRFAVLGDPIAHSKSPAMHAAAYGALGLAHSYEAIRATPEDLPALVKKLRGGEYDGFNVTIPHKRRILDLADSVDASALAVGAANTLVRANGKIIAHNTDVPALARELLGLAPQRTSDEWHASRALVLGTGGAARSAVVALAEIVGAGEVVVRGRNPAAFVEEMRALLASRSVKGSIVAEPLSPSKFDPSFTCIVQATSAGMHGAEPGDGVAAAVAWDDVPENTIALDVIYAPPQTPFLRAASKRGLRLANGFGMLARQGALAFELWLGIPAPYAAMLAALTSASAGS